jgi:hypothetical protein
MICGATKRRFPFITAISLLMVAILFSLAIGIGRAEEDKPKTDSKAGFPKLNRKIVDEHRQIASMSCIPMSIEMVLKLLERAPAGYYDLQIPWKNRSDGNFNDFEGKTIKGITFHKQFGFDRDDRFPLAKLFAKIDQELNAGRYVIISLASDAGWHMYVIYGEDAEGDFLAVSKADEKTIEAAHLKRIVTKMKGTDILTYDPVR